MKPSRPIPALVLLATLSLGACTEGPVAPPSPSDDAALQPGQHRGTGLVIDNLTGLSLPLIGEVGNLVIDQAILTELTLVEDITGQIIGLEAAGTVSGVLSATGQELVDEQFTSSVLITSDRPGQCDVVTVDLGGLTIDRIPIVTADLPEVEVAARGSGAVGSLLCGLGSIVGGITNPIIRGLVRALNNLI